MVLCHVCDIGFVPGAAGIDVFFIISGFILGTLAVNAKPGEFLVKRLARIVPIYWVATLTLCGFASLHLMWRFTYDGEQLLKSLFFIPYAAPEGSMAPLLVRGWTLDHEVQFYLIFALGLALRAPIAWSIMLIVVLAGWGMLIEPDSVALRAWTSPILLEFAAGLALATVVKPLGAIKGSIMLAIGVVSFVYVGWFANFDPPYRLISAGLPSFLIVCGVLAIERAGAWPALMRPFEAGGNISYSLYLLHGFVIAIGHRLFGATLLTNLVIVAASIALAVLSYHLVERPVARFLIGLALRRRERPVAVAEAHLLPPSPAT